MNLSIRDIPSLGRPLLVLAACLVMCGVAISYSGALVKRAEAGLKSSRDQLFEARERVRRSGEERDVILQYVGPYRELEQRGVLGEEQRLSWTDALRAANADAQLYGVDFELGVQQPYTFTAEAEAGGLPVQQSVMKLRFGVLHENDVINFFRALDAHTPSVFAVNQCTMHRLGSNTSRPINQPTLRAECEVAWITIPAPVEGGS
jgi:hypothetical protein